MLESRKPLAGISVQPVHGQTSTTEKIYIHKNNIAKTENMQTLQDAIGI